MTQHTPGTWTSDHGTRSSWVHLGDKDDGRVVEVKGDNHQNDADFIAEAPAMLEALEDARNLLTDEQFGTTAMERPEWFKRAYGVVEKIDAALAQSEGEPEAPSVLILK